MVADIVERYLAVDIRRIMREFLKQPGSPQRGRIETEYAFVQIDTLAKTIIINSQATHLLASPCNYGGVRWWFMCPACNRRCALLYYTGSVWTCRKCLGLHYKSQQSTKTDPWTWYRQAERIARRIDPEFTIKDGFYAANADWWYFPKRPKGMHTATYERMRAEFFYYLDRGGKMLVGGAMRILGNKYT